MNARASLHERLDRWQADVTSICGRFDTGVADAERFHGAIAARRLDALDIADIELGWARVMKRRPQLTDAQHDCYFLIQQIEGEAAMAQEGSEAHLLPNDCTIIDSRRASEFRYGSSMRQRSVHMPHALVRELTGLPELACGRRIDGSRGLGALFSATLSQFSALGDTLSDDERRVGLESLFHLLTRLLADGGGGSLAGVNRPTLTRIKAWIDARLGDANLTPDSIASAFNVSRRQLYRLFEDAETTPTAWLWERRLARAMQVLADESCARASILEIAFSLGFNDAAHFSRSFRKKVGQTPSDYRQQALAARR
ncbi:transcriptional regulator FeaR [Parapedomonas caeni]|jgi:AraC-like DNA-binding protein